MSEQEDILLAKWLAKDISETELRILEKSYDLDELSVILERQNQYMPVTMDSDDMWAAINKKHNQPSEQLDTNAPKSRKALRILSLIVALVLAKFIYGFFFGSDIIRIKTKEKQNTQIAFMDGSSALIGPYSTLNYNQEKWNKERKLNLRGQAFFDVTEGTGFSVVTAAGRIEVLGTQFDVWNIDSEYMRVACKEGRVKVIDTYGTSSEITANEEIYVNAGKLTAINQLVTSANDWQQNFRNYHTTPIKLLLKDLERFYDVSFSLDDSSKNDVFSGILPTDSIEKCILFLETSLSYETEVSGKNIFFIKSE